MARAPDRLRQNARRMRKAPTRSEDRIWSWLRSRRFSGHKFRRQYPIGGYILDFYCSELRLAIELDGSHHAEPWMADYEGRRMALLQRQGIEVLKIPNVLLIRDRFIVAACIQAAIDRRLSR